MGSDAALEPPRVVIVGAGLGGLAAAVGLRCIGADVLVLERREAHSEAGAGITLFTNALRALDALGLGPDVRRLGDAVGSGGVRTPRGHWLTRSTGADASRRAGVELVTVHRADLQRLLLSKLPRDVVRTGVTVTEVQDPVEGAARVSSSAGDFEADLIIGGRRRS